VGTCGALDPRLALGDLLVPIFVLACDGTSRAIGDSERVSPDQGLLRTLRASGELAPVEIASVDLFYGAEEVSLFERGAQALDMECATLFTLAPKLDLQTAAVLIVSDTLRPRRHRIAPDALQEAELAAGALAARALSTERSQEVGAEAARAHSRKPVGASGS
jgi:purine-nucleoside phosphorylase